MFSFRRCMISVSLATSISSLLLFAVQGATINVGQDAEFSKIQDAINSANPGDIIEVKNGTYAENINVAKPITLRGVGSPVVDANGLGNAIALSSDGVTLEGFHAVNSNQAGIKVTSSGNTIKNNQASGNSIGLDLVNSNHNFLRSNLLNNNLANFEVMFVRYDLSFYNDIDTSNLADGKPIYYIVGASDKVVDTSSKAGVVYCISCRNISVRGLKLTNNAMGIILVNCNYSILENNWIEQNKGGGIFLQGSENNIVRNNSIIDNDRAGLFLSASCNNIVTSNKISNDIYGIFLLASSNNLLKDNIVSSNDEGIKLFQGSVNNRIIGNEISENKIGISAKNSADNKIYLNNYVNNTRQADPGSNNFWNSTERVTYSYLGKKSKDYIGNFWSDYSGRDEGNDGLGDTPYALGSDRDWHPLISRFGIYDLQEMTGDRLGLHES
jgi:parallel beta-helix repeat protein